MLRLIRGLIVFCVMAFMVMFLGQSDVVKTIYTDVFYSFTQSEFQKSNFVLQRAILKKDKNFEGLELEPNIINFDFENTAAAAYANPGDQGKELMRIVIKSDQHEIHFKKIKFKVFGLEAGYLDSVYFEENQKKLKEGKIKEGYVIFDDLNINMAPDTKRVISIKADFSDQLRSGKRLRLDVEQDVDMELFVDDVLHDVRDTYPIYGKYLSIVNTGA